MTFFDRKWRLCACRVNAGYTQREVAEKIGVCEVTVIKWEAGITSPKSEYAQKLSELYAVPMAYIDFSKEGNKVPLRHREELSGITQDLLDT